MTPDQLAVMGHLLTLLKAMSSWPFGVAFFVFVVGPWVLALILFYSQRKRFETVVSMYESNVRLVEKYENLAGDLKEVIIMNTQAITRLDDGMRGNQFCPMVRLEKKAQGVQGG